MLASAGSMLVKFKPVCWSQIFTMWPSELTTFLPEEQESTGSKRCDILGLEKIGYALLCGNMLEADHFGGTRLAMHVAHAGKQQQ